ncbi:MAG: glycosyltransferase family 9 protein [Verrucomicrobia bacterium]|jgi:ADP-heptose:LPS heptosyltransferase|nr:glycosyltransferase family 9 protein [Verrucomicrobiota bacterium]
MSTPKGRILVIRGGAIGDFILTLPSLAALRRQFPDAHLEVLGYPHIAQLALAGGCVDAAHPIEARGLAGFFARHGPLDAAVAGYFAGFNLIVSYLFDPDDIFKTNLASCTRAHFIQGPHRPDESSLTHATAVYLKPLEQLAIFDADPVPRLTFLPMESQPGTVVLHPGSGSDRKNWPEARWADLLSRLLEQTQHPLLLVGGEAEGDRLNRLVAALPESRFRLASSLPLVELARRMCGCAVFVGHDSGITHLAAALGLPCLALWPDTNEVIWRPRGERVVVLKEPRGLRALDVDWVFNQLQGLLVEAAG